MFDDKSIKLLALSKNEVKMLKALEERERQSVASLSHIAKIPRMTTYLTLASLKSRGLIKYSQTGKRKFRQIADKEKMSAIFRKTDFSVIKGLENLWNIWERAANSPKYGRIYGIQPTASLKEILSKIDWEEKISPVNSGITKNKLIVEGLIREDYILNYLKPFEGNKEKQHQILLGLQNRSSDMIYVSNDYFNKPVDFLMFENHGYIINWKSEVAIEIKNKDTLDFLKELFDLARGYGKKVGQGAYIRELAGKI
jgi:predicted transcriptional regulator